MKAALLFVFSALATLMSAQTKTFCNPMNLDYGFCPIPDFVKGGKHRATADPCIVTFKGDYYLFSTNQWGYWWSHDLLDWHFVSRKFVKQPKDHVVYDELCAPAAWAMGDELYLIGSTYEKDWPIWKSKNPKVDDWVEATPKFPVGAWDPAFFYDDDGRLYLYHGSSNTLPLYGWEIDPKTLQPIGEHKELIRLDPVAHGWERFGEAHDNTFLAPFIEGSWMDKHDGKYYLQYGAPGTEFSGYADGVYVSDKPLGPFVYQPHNPFCMKLGGFARGSGHGGTFKDRNGNWWHVSTIGVCVKNNFERRIGLWPTDFDKDGVMHSDTAWGDYPNYLPDAKFDPDKGLFTGWMLLNYNKPVRVSSTLGGFAANYAVDENLRTYWSAKTGAKGEWLESDLGEVSTIKAIQINFADQDAESMGKRLDIYHQYEILGSTDGKHWTSIVDKRKNKTDVPHDYVELKAPVEARYVKIVNEHMADGKFALSGLRVFGNGHGHAPSKVREFIALRGDSERRNAWLKWAANDDTTGYNIYYGLAPDKLYTSVMVYGASEFYLRTMDAKHPYFFAIEPFNENGVGPRSPVAKAE